MAKKKSNAQIRRAIKRAAERGETYVPPQEGEEEETENKNPESDEVDNSQELTTESGKKTENKDQDLLNAALQLRKELEEIQNNESLRAKERRSNKRKAEAIAAESAGISVEEMQKWYEENQEKLESMVEKGADKSKDKKGNSFQNKPTPYIVFVGQLAFTTTKDKLFEHIKKELGAEHTITPETVKIRLLTDSKTKKSRGMAFVELSDPETMYACLKLHHTMLDERRINIERSAGGSKAKRQTKIKEFREQQQEYLANSVDSILGEYIKTGELKEGELDEGCINLCKRHTAALVEATLKEYIEKNGRTMDNPSAYFTFLLTKLATEGVRDPTEKKRGSDKSDGKFPTKKKAKTTSSSVFSHSALKGVDFSLSEDAPSGKDGKNDLSDIFPSLSGGRRGRGRGYM